MTSLGASITLNAESGSSTSLVQHSIEAHDQASFENDQESEWRALPRVYER